MIRADGVVKLMDFGVAALNAAHIEWQGECTPKYAAPELLRHEVPTPASDVYSFGLLAFELLTGRLEAPYRLSGRSRLGSVIERCLRGEPGERYANGGELVEALAAVRQTQRTAIAGVAAACLLSILGFVLGGCADRLRFR